jgi:hypothetical protein
MATYYVDFEGGNDANNGTTFALRKKTLSSATTTWAKGDTVRVMASPAPTSLGVNGTWTKDSNIITLSAAVTKTVDNCESGWTAAANITVAHISTLFRQGTNCVRLTPVGAFTTGLMAYKALGSAQDFSSFQQICLWLRSDTARAASFFTLRLCSDALGVTAVNTINLPQLIANQWQKVVVDTGGALGASIQSVAIYAASDPGTGLLYVDNIFTSKAPGAADELTLASLISTNDDSPAAPWLSIGSVDGTTITLNGGADQNASTPSTARYRLATVTTPAYVRQPIELAAQEDINNNPSGSGANGIVEGGWNRTDMSTKVDKTYMRRQNRNGQVAINMFARATIDIRSFAGEVGGGYLIYNNQNNFCNVSDCDATGCLTSFYFRQPSQTGTFRNVNSYHSKYAIETAGIIDFYGDEWTFDQLWGSGAADSDALFLGNNSSNERYCEFVLIGNNIYNFGAGVSSTAGAGWARVTFRDAVFSNNTDDIDFFGELYLWKTTHDDLSLPLTTSLGANLGLVHGNQLTDAGAASVVPSLYFNGRSGGAVVRRSTAQRRTASDYSWEMSVDSSAIDYDMSSVPMAQIACPANEPRTIKVWAYTANAEGIGRIRVKGTWYDGVPSDVVDELTTTASWEQLSITFTPTEEVVVTVFMEALYVSNSATRKAIYFDDLTVT